MKTSLGGLTAQTVSGAHAPTPTDSNKYIQATTSNNFGQSQNNILILNVNHAFRKGLGKPGLTLGINRATSYSPTHLRMQYHRG